MLFSVDLAPREEAIEDLLQNALLGFLRPEHRHDCFLDICQEHLKLLIQLCASEGEFFLDDDLVAGSCCHVDLPVGKLKRPQVEETLNESILRDGRIT